MTEKRRMDVNKHHIIRALAIVCVMSTICACGKTKETTVVTEPEVTEELERTVEDETEAEAAETSQQESDTESVEAAPSPEPTESVMESSEEGPADELTVDMSKVKTFDAAKTMYAIKNVNARKGPATDYESLGMLKAGDMIEVIGQDESGWYEFKYKNEIAFASNDFLSEENPLAAVTDPALAETAQTVPDPAAPAPAADPAAQPTPAVPAKVVTAPAGVLMIGDSRCVQMRDITGGGGCSWICQKAKGYSWFESTAIPQADEIVGKGTKVVIAMGVNDVDNVYNYANLINLKAAEWAARGAKTYFVSVNPVWENPYVTEDQVVAFNSTMASSLIGVRWIDTHSYLIANGYTMVDGMHFDDATNLRVFQAIVGSLR